MTGSLWLNLPSSGLICPHQVQIEVICLLSLGVRAEGCIFLCVNVNRIKRNIIEIAPVFIVLSHPRGPLLTSWKSGVRVDMGTYLSMHCVVSVSPFLQIICDLLCLTVVVLWTAFDIWHFLSSASE